MKKIIVLLLVFCSQAYSADSINCVGTGEFKNVSTHDLKLKSTTQILENVILADNNYIAEVQVNSSPNNKNHAVKVIAYKRDSLGKPMYGSLKPEADKNGYAPVPGEVIYSVNGSQIHCMSK